MPSAALLIPQQLQHLPTGAPMHLNTSKEENSRAHFEQTIFVKGLQRMGRTDGLNGRVQWAQWNGLNGTGPTDKELGSCCRGSDCHGICCRGIS